MGEVASYVRGVEGIAIGEMGIKVRCFDRYIVFGIGAVFL